MFSQFGLFMLEDLCIPDPWWEKKECKLIEFQLDVRYSESSCKGE